MRIQSLLIARIVWTSTLTLCSLYAGSAVYGAEPLHSDAQDAQQSKLEDSLIAAAEAEITGDHKTRTALLSEVLQTSPNHELARSQLGFVRTNDGDWLSIDESRTALPHDKLNAYAQRREQAKDTVEDQLALANYCNKQKLADQRRAHLNRVLALKPDHAQARKALGFTRVGDQWTTADDRAAAQARAKFVANSVKKYGEQLQGIFSVLNDPQNQKHAHAIEQLNQLPIEVLPAAEVFFDSNSETSINAFMDWVASFKDAESSITLARYAVFHPSDSVRYRACQKLENRNLYDYVPYVLQFVSQPLHIEYETGLLAGVIPVTIQHLIKEDADTVHVHSNVVEVPPSKVNVPNPLLRARFIAQLNPFWQQLKNNEEMASQLNTTTAAYRQRCARLFSQVSGTTVDCEMDSLHKWWDDVTEYESANSSRKPALRSTDLYLGPERYRRTILLQDGPTGYRLWLVLKRAPDNSGETMAFVYRGSCFIKGTPVLTHQGMRPIEEVKIGDLVLSKNTVSGQLSWQPVLQTTHRTPAPTVFLNTGEDRIHCTGSHVFGHPVPVGSKPINCMLAMCYMVLVNPS